MNLKDFVDETRNGIEAFLGSLLVAKNEPERLAAFAATDTTAVSKVAGWERTEAVAEPLIPVLIGGTAVRSSRPWTEKAKVGVALAGSGISRARKSAEPTAPSSLSTAATVAKYAGYAAALQQDVGATVRTEGLVARGALVAAGAGLAAITNRRLVLPTLVGGAAMVYATELANDPDITHTGNVEARGIRHGANFLVASEALTTTRGTLLKNRTGWGARAVDALALYTGSIGHVMLVDGLMRR